MKVPVLSDFSDDRALHGSSSSESWIDLLWVVIPSSLGAIVAATSGLEILFKGSPGWLALARVGIGAALAAGCAIVIAARRQATRAGFGTRSANVAQLEYRYPQHARTFCKLAFVPLAILPLYQLANLTPNRLLGSSSIRGYLCVVGSQAPVRLATIDLMNALNETSVVAQELSDDTGFFVADLKPWAPRPEKLVIVGGLCSGAVVDLVARARTGAGCPGERLDIERSTIADQWEVACPVPTN